MEDFRNIAVDGNRMEVAWHGPGPDRAPTLVFLHEGLGCVALWNDFPARLSRATGCGALVVSRTGYGRSDPCPLPRPIRFMHDEGLHVLPKLIDAAGIRRCILVGHSDGGSIALIHAGGTQAARICGIITEAAHVFCEELTVKSIEAAREAYLHTDLRKRLKKYHGDNVDCAFWGWNDVWLDPDFMKWNIEEYLPGIKVPVLAIQGKEDQYGTPAQVRAIAEKTGSEVTVKMLPNCRHSPHKEQPEMTLEAMTEFIFRIFPELTLPS